MKRLVIIVCAVIISRAGFSQERFFTKKARVSFISKAPLENIEAVNQVAVSVLDKSSGQLDFSVLIKGFEFAKALMQEHFNEDYMESDKYPKAIFRGRIEDISVIDFKKDGKYQVAVSGKLMLHGETRDIHIPAELVIDKGIISCTSEFSITLEDYHIMIPGIVKDNIAKTVKVAISTKYEPLN